MIKLVDYYATNYTLLVKEGGQVFLLINMILTDYLMKLDMMKLIIIDLDQIMDLVSNYFNK